MSDSNPSSTLSMEAYWDAGSWPDYPYVPEHGSEYGQQGSSARAEDEDILNKAISSSASDSAHFTDYGLQIALKNQLKPLPIPDSRRTRKDGKYIYHLDARRKELQRVSTVNAALPDRR